VLKIKVLLDEVSTLKYQIRSRELDGFTLNMAALRFNETFTSRYGGNTSEDINFNI